MPGTSAMAPASASPAGVVAVCPLAALQVEGARWVQDGIAVVHEGGRFFAFEQACPHAGASLVEGEIRRGAVSCPRHRARFRLRDGKVLSGPSRRPLLCYDVEQAGSSLLVKLRPVTVGEGGVLRRLLGRLRHAT